MGKVTIKLSQEEQRNLLILLDSVQVKGIQAASEYLHIINIVQQAKSTLNEDVDNK